MGDQAGGPVPRPRLQVETEGLVDLAVLVGPNAAELQNEGFCPAPKPTAAP